MPRSKFKNHKLYERAKEEAAKSYSEETEPEKFWGTVNKIYDNMINRYGKLAMLLIANDMYSRYDDLTQPTIGPRNKYKNIILVGILLDKQSKNALKKWWENNVGELLPKQYMHHVTLAFKPGIELVEDLAENNFLGKTLQINVIGYAGDDTIQAVAVDVPGLPFTADNKILHITVSTQEGTPPVRSNDLLAKGYNSVIGPKLSGIIYYMARGKNLIELAWDPNELS
ncbi:MAG: hypothetical protein R3213_05540 [Flavobacteriaceae bacterium]|nr:hypothetical protein [Flavobacteriaceae bacterium]